MKFAPFPCFVASYSSMFAAQKIFFLVLVTALYFCLTIAFYLEEACVPIPNSLLLNVKARVHFQELDILIGQFLLNTTRAHHTKMWFFFFHNFFFHNLFFISHYWVSQIRDSWSGESDNSSQSLLAQYSTNSTAEFSGSALLVLSKTLWRSSLNQLSVGRKSSKILWAPSVQQLTSLTQQLNCEAQ